MKKVFLLIALLAAGCPAKAGPGPATNTGGGAGGGTFWDVLAVPGRRWVLHDTMVEEPPQPELVITVADVRTVGDAKIVKLAGTVQYTPDSEPEDQGTYVQILAAQWAVSPRGLWMLDGELDDAAIAAAIDGPPHWASPPVASDPETGRYAKIDDVKGEKVVCIGEIPDLGGEDCLEVCGGGMCVAEHGGIVQVDAQWSPDPYSIYEQDAYKHEP
jgi:hypothetical protein